MHQSDTPKGLPHQADELHDAPCLSALRGQMGGNMPKDYFDSFRNRLNDRMQDADALAEAPTLTAFGRDWKPGPPEDYFDQFSKRLQQTIHAPSKSKVIPLWKQPQVWAIAAGIIVLVALGLGITPSSPQSPEAENLFADMSDQELLALAEYTGAEAEDVVALFSIDEISYDGLEDISEEEGEALLEGLEIDEADILDFINEP
ncbi:MAG: hypothetical protein AB8F95_07505 [Bacteroidia bacterium]